MADDAGALEKEFRYYYANRMLPVARAGIGVGILMIVVLSMLDWQLMPPEFVEKALPLRAVLMFIPLSAAMGAMFLFKGRIWLPYLVASAALVVGISALALEAIAVQSDARMPFWGGIFVTFYVYLVLGLTVRQSMSVGWMIFAVYVAIAISMGAPLDKVGYGIVLLGFSNVVGTYGSYLLERDAREIFDKNKELARLARTDGLTGLFNRRTFDEHLHQVWKQARRDDKKVAIVVADIDHFKLYNDCYGHRKGDTCIKAIADVLADSVSRPLDIVARYGGEEYVIVLYDPTVSFLETFTRSLCHKVIDLDIEHKAAEATPSISLSIGAAITDANGNLSYEQLLRQADDALYEAKNQGRNQAIVYRAEWGQQTTANLAAVLL